MSDNRTEDGQGNREERTIPDWMLFSVESLYQVEDIRNQLSDALWYHAAARAAKSCRNRVMADDILAVLPDALADLAREGSLVATVD